MARPPGPAGTHKATSHGGVTYMHGARVKAHTFNKVNTIVVIYNRETSRGSLYAIGGGNSVALKAEVVVGGQGHVTPTGIFHADRWERDHVSTKYGSYANTPWSHSPLGLNAFGPYQLHIKELESRGIYIHGTIGPGWNPVTTLNTLVSPTSHGCVRMSNSDIIRLHDDLLPDPEGTQIRISTNPDDAPKERP